MKTEKPRGECTQRVMFRRSMRGSADQTDRPTGLDVPEAVELSAARACSPANMFVTNKNLRIAYIQTFTGPPTVLRKCPILGVDEDFHYWHSQFEEEQSVIDEDMRRWSGMHGCPKTYFGPWSGHATWLDIPDGKRYYTKNLAKQQTAIHCMSSGVREYHKHVEEFMDLYHEEYQSIAPMVMDYNEVERVMHNGNVCCQWMHKSANVHYVHKGMDRGLVDIEVQNSQGLKVFTRKANMASDEGTVWRLRLGPLASFSYVCDHPDSCSACSGKLVEPSNLASLKPPTFNTSEPSSVGMGVPGKHTPCLCSPLLSVHVLNAPHPFAFSLSLGLPLLRLYFAFPGGAKVRGGGRGGPPGGARIRGGHGEGKRAASTGGGASVGESSHATVAKNAPPPPGAAFQGTVFDLCAP